MNDVQRRLAEQELREENRDGADGLADFYRSQSIEGVLSLLSAYCQ